MGASYIKCQTELNFRQKYRYGKDGLFFLSV